MNMYVFSLLTYSYLFPFVDFAITSTAQTVYHSLVCHQGVRPHTWHGNQCRQGQGQGQGRGQQHSQHECDGHLPSDYLVLLACTWRTNPAKRLPMNRVIRQLDLFIKKENLLYESQQLVTQSSRGTDNEHRSVHQSVSYNNLDSRPAVMRNRARHCGGRRSSMGSVSSCGSKRSRRFVDMNVNATFPTQATTNDNSHMIRQFMMDNMNDRNYQQRHCDIMSAARNMLTNDPIMDHRLFPQQPSQRSQSQSNFRNASMHRPQLFQQQQQQFQQQQETRCSPDHSFSLHHQQQQQQQQKEQRFKMFLNFLKIN